MIPSGPGAALLCKDLNACSASEAEKDVSSNASGSEGSTEQRIIDGMKSGKGNHLDTPQEGVVTLDFWTQHV